jgi:hypothetical protein
MARSTFPHLASIEGEETSKREHESIIRARGKVKEESVESYKEAERGRAIDKESSKVLFTRKLKLLR